MSFTHVTSFFWDTRRGVTELQVVKHPGVAFGWGGGCARSLLGLGWDFGKFGVRLKVRG